jgi:bifunctional DNA-binding transcriptional regulator/antitoxin component of YhaV-PrlF toxin-antitoxin module
LDSVSKVAAIFQNTFPVRLRKELGNVSGTEGEIIKERQRYLPVVNTSEDLKKKRRGRSKGGVTMIEYFDDMRGPAN